MQYFKGLFMAIFFKSSSIIIKDDVIGLIHEIFAEKRFRDKVNHTDMFFISKNKEYFNPIGL